MNAPSAIEAFPHHWTAEVLRQPPLIAPAQQFVYPQNVSGEEDALARGALYVAVRSASGNPFLATCALGFSDPSLPSGVWLDRVRKLPVYVGFGWVSGGRRWEGVRRGDVPLGGLHGTGWDMFADREVPFAMDLLTGAHEGGGYRR